MAKHKFKLTVDQAILEDCLGCSLRTLYKLKKEGQLIEGIHFVTNYGKSHRYSRKALRTLRREKERQVA